VLQPWEKDKMKKRNEEEIGNVMVFPPIKR
jgi:hypothetical protein